ncbi:MAG TPA: T9SS type A sorting domain-containing protein [Flavisolibacter sp.]|jgi:hypothetical protein|nr:T9SS type A sorting domain-containing protein [Flavisolibacter sp.]
MKNFTPKRSFRIRLLSFLLYLFLHNLSYSQNIDFGKSYINVTKGLNGGTVEPGDILEIRAALVVKSGSYDSCGYTDAIPAGTSYISNTIRVLTNEGKIYKQFTDAVSDDEGQIAAGNVSIHLGFSQSNAPARWFRRGRVTNTDRPSFYNSTCIMIASFRVQVTNFIGSVISIGGGTMTYKSGASALQTFVFPANLVAVYTNFGICSNAIGTNALGTENNGSFGSGTTQHRGTSANVPAGYTYATFTAGGPNDYFYGIANNTSNSANFTTSNSWAIPDNSSPTHRVFSVWDIIGDHTGASNPALGNPASNIGSTGGYMLVINAAYRIDSAFQQTISNLCPNTYYEISCWMRNICSRCGCDSAGRGAGSGGYIPTAPNDSSGVYPNITFEVDGLDYYTTGNLLYTGQWVKKGFTFRTGPTQTSFTLKFFNNAPGGGGNDWALDDISVATCGPNLAFTPSNQPTVCKGNVVDIGSYVRSYFNNYTQYKWQKSTNNGVTWADAGVSGTGTPVWNGSAWQYFTAFPSFIATMSDSGTKFRVVVATTASNINNPSCAFSDITSILTLNVIDCGNPLQTNFLSFTAKTESGLAQLTWTTSKEEEPLNYFIEKSIDGLSFSPVGTIKGGNSIGNELNRYSWSEPVGGTQPVFYRIRMVNANKEKVSRIIKLVSNQKALQFVNVPNPFKHQLVAEVTADRSQIVHLQLIDNFGKVVKRQQYTLSDGTNQLVLTNTEALAAGLYTVQLLTDQTTVTKRVLKQ